MKEFLEKYELYQEYLLLENYTLNNEEFTHISEFMGENFEYFCPVENSMRPFELDFPDRIKETITSNFSFDEPEWKSKQIPEENFINEKLNYTFWILGKCKSCNNHVIHFLLNVLKPYPF